MDKIFGLALAVIIGLFWICLFGAIPALIVWLLWPFTGEYFGLPALGFFRSWAVVITAACLFKSSK